MSGVVSQLATTNTVAAVFAQAVTAFIVLCTLIPLIKSGRWYVRVCDFPRVQLMVLCGVAFVAILASALMGGWSARLTMCIGLILISAGWQAWHIFQYTGLWNKTVATSDASDLRLLVCNLDYQNTRSREIIEIVSEINPQILLLIEINERWNQELATMRGAYPYRVEAIEQKGLGIALWSQVQIQDGQVETLVSDDRPSVWATLKHQDSDIRFVGVHPTPPGLSKRGAAGRHDSRIRDAELILIANQVAQQREAAWVVAGDFNDVAWSHTTRLFQRLSGLKDPRVGRGMFSTYHAKYPLWRYPLDHVFVSPGFRVAHLGRIKIPGSDHFGMVAELDTPNAAAGVDPKPDSTDRHEANELIAQGMKDADVIGDKQS